MWSLPCGLIPRGGSGCAPEPGSAFSRFYFFLLCVFLFVCSFLGLFSFCLAVKICTFTLQIVNSKNCILNFYMREEEPTSIYIYINISLYIYIQIYIKQMLCHLVAFLWLKKSFIFVIRWGSGWEKGPGIARRAPGRTVRCRCGSRRCHRAPRARVSQSCPGAPPPESRAGAPGLSFPGYFSGGDGSGARVDTPEVCWTLRAPFRGAFFSSENP